MASGGSQNSAVAWELSKENVQPVKSGRNVSCIQAVLEPSEEDAERLLKEKQRFEEEIFAAENSEDPIGPWHRYLEWTIQNFPTGKNKKSLQDLLSKFLGKFKGGQYNDDYRYVNGWLKLADSMDDPLEIYSYMSSNEIGKFVAEFYIAWADEYEKCGDTRKVDRIYMNGLGVEAKPLELLEKRHMEFQFRVARGVSKNDVQQDGGKERVAFSQLGGGNEHDKVGSVRVGSSYKPLNGQPLPKKSNVPSSQWEIYDENSDGVTVMGGTGKWASVPSKSLEKENMLEPGKWNDGRNERHICPIPTDRLAPQINFEIYEDKDQDGYSLDAPRQSRTMMKSVLSDKKDFVPDFSKIKSVLHEMPVQDERSKSYYDVENVYTVMGEMQFEEFRAAIYRKRQRIVEEQKCNLQQRMLEEEKARLLQIEKARMEEERLFVLEQMQMKEMERKVMETKRLKMKQLKLDFENRLREIRALDKTAATQQEADDLHREEEDITIKLGAVERKLRKSEQFIQVKYESARNANLGLQRKERSGIDQTSAHLVQGPSEEVQSYTSVIHPTSGNNSLNHSRRSQPSPTVNTKEAMTTIKGWFQKSLDDDEFEEELSVKVEPDRPLARCAANQEANVDDENAVPFEIFDENSTNTLVPVKSTHVKKGLSSRGFPSSDCETENATNKPGESNDLHPYVDDKTDTLFDDVTVAGSHFTAKARMASTPAVKKSNVLQDSQHYGNLSCIPSYPCMQKFTHNVNQSEDNQNSQYGYEDSHSTEDIGMPVNKVNKELTPIPEVSKESERSSLASQKSTVNQMESSVLLKQANDVASNMQALCGITSTSVITTEAQGHNLLTDVPCHNGTSDMHEHGDVTKVTVESADSQNMSENDELDGSQLSNFSFWGVGDDPDVVTDNVGKESDNKSSSENVVLEQAECVERVEQAALLIKDIACRSLNTIHDPWDDSLLSDVLQNSNSLTAGLAVPIVRHKGVLPVTLKSGVCLEFDEKYKVGKLVGQGAFAKVYQLSNKDLVLKAQFPPCAWEVYAMTTARKRLLHQGMHDIAEAIINVNSAFFYDNCSLLLLPRFNNGTLLDVVNARQKDFIMKDPVAMWIAYKVMKVVHSLHTVGIIHGDIKPDNFMINDNADGDIRTSIKLIDFGRAIDMTAMPKQAMFTRDCGTSGFRCIQMKHEQPWNYHIDYYGIAGTLYVVLFGAYMKVKQSDDGSWKMTGRLKRWNKQSVWDEFFDLLINHPTPCDDKPTGHKNSPLPKLLEKFYGEITANSKVPSLVNSFFTSQ